MEEENNNNEKRKRKAPERFESWKKGDPHPPMAERSRKSKERKDQKRYRDIRKKKSQETIPQDSEPVAATSKKSSKNSKVKTKDKVVVGGKTRMKK